MLTKQMLKYAILQHHSQVKLQFSLGSNERVRNIKIVFCLFTINTICTWKVSWYIDFYRSCVTSSNNVACIFPIFMNYSWYRIRFRQSQCNWKGDLLFGTTFKNQPKDNKIVCFTNRGAWFRNWTIVLHWIIFTDFSTR